MPPQISPCFVARDALYCMGLGAGMVLLRMIFPAGKHSIGKDVFDFLAVLFCGVLLQSYAVRYADAGQLRWYHVLGALLGAYGMQGTVGSRVCAFKSRWFQALRKNLCAKLCSHWHRKAPRVVKKKRKM